MVFWVRNERNSGAVWPEYIRHTLPVPPSSSMSQPAFMKVSRFWIWAVLTPLAPAPPALVLTPVLWVSQKLELTFAVLAALPTKPPTSVPVPVTLPMA